MNKELYFVLGNLGNYVVETELDQGQLSIWHWGGQEKRMKEKWSLEIGIAGTILLRKKWRLSCPSGRAEF